MIDRMLYFALGSSRTIYMYTEASSSRDKETIRDVRIEQVFFINKSD